MVGILQPDNKDRIIADNHLRILELETERNEVREALRQVYEVYHLISEAHDISEENRDNQAYYSHTEMWSDLGKKLNEIAVPFLKD